MSTEPVRVQSGLVVSQVTPSAAAGGTKVFSKIAVGDAQESGVVNSNETTGFRSMKNMSATVTMYFAETAAGATALAGWPLEPKETFTFAGSGRVHTGNIYVLGDGAAKLALLQY